jgi:hypothetical protein
VSATLFKEVTYSLAKLIEDIELGEIALPNIQRPFVWENTKVRDLFDSMYKGFPVGYLLFWVNTHPGTTRQIGAGQKQNVPRLLIIDGQQRLTSLFAVLKGIPVLRENYKHERIYIAFRPRDKSFAVADAAIRRSPEYIADISQLWSGEVPRNRFVKDFLKRLEVSDHEEDELSEAIDWLYDLRNYPFTVLELSSTVSAEDVADVFVRINSKGTPLNVPDFILTLMSVFWEEGRVALEEFSRASKTTPPTGSSPSPHNPFIQPNPDQMLRVAIGFGFRRARLQNVYSILRGKDLVTGQFSVERREQQFATLASAQARTLSLQNWAEFLKTLVRAGYSNGGMIPAKNSILYSYVFYLIGKHEFNINPFALRNVIARWFFMAYLTGRYSGNPEGQMEQDLARLRDVQTGQDFITSLDQVIATTFTEDYWNISLPNAMITSSGNTPPLFAYHAALNLLDARALFSKIRVSDLLAPGAQAYKSPVERHHLFPVAYLRKLGITGTRNTNQIANFAHLEWFDNIAVSDAPPAEYFPKFAARLSASELAQMYYWHALPTDWENMPYQDFLIERRRLMAQVIRDGFSRLGD